MLNSTALGYRVGFQRSLSRRSLSHVLVVRAGIRRWRLSRAPTLPEQGVLIMPLRGKVPFLRILCRSSKLKYQMQIPPPLEIHINKLASASKANLQGTLLYKLSRSGRANLGPRQPDLTRSHLSSLCSLSNSLVIPDLTFLSLLLSSLHIGI